MKIYLRRTSSSNKTNFGSVLPNPRQWDDIPAYDEIQCATMLLDSRSVGQ